MDVVFLDKDAAMVTYKITVQGTQDGKDDSGSYNYVGLEKARERLASRLSHRGKDGVVSSRLPIHPNPALKDKINVIESVKLMN